MMHIKGENRKRLCGSTGNYEPVGSDDELPLCEKCAQISLATHGEAFR